jgi:hypothetical protein
MIIIIIIQLLYGCENMRGKTKYVMYVWRNTVARPRNVYTTSANPAAMPFQIQRLYCHWMSSTTIKRTWIFIKRPKLWLNFNQIWIFFTEFGESPQYQISGKYGSHSAKCEQTNRRMDGHDIANTRFSWLHDQIRGTHRRILHWSNCKYFTNICVTMHLELYYMLGNFKCNYTACLQ